MRQRRVADEHPIAPVRIVQAPPESLRGTLYSIGPSKTERPGGFRESFALSQASVLAIHFDESSVSAGIRLLRTPSWIREQRSGRLLYRSFTVATHRPVSALIRSESWHPANGGLFARGARLFAVGPTGPSVPFDGDTLESQHTAGVDGIHDAFVGAPQRLRCRAASYVVTRSRRGTGILAFPDERAAKRIAELETSKCCAWPSFAVTDDYVVLIEPPLVLAGGWPGPAQVPVCSALQWERFQSTRVVVVPIDAAAAPIELRIEGRMIFHVVSASQIDGSALVIEVTAQENPWPSLAWWAGHQFPNHSSAWEATIHRITIDLHAGSAMLECAGAHPVLAMSYSAEQRCAFLFGWSDKDSKGPPNVLFQKCDRNGLKRFTLEVGTLRGLTHVGRPGNGRYAIVLANNPNEDAASVYVLDIPTGEVAGLVEIPWHIPRRNHGLFQPREA
jgi:carotenoid cleavage dioxygenase-like enzyme